MTRDELAVELRERFGLLLERTDDWGCLADRVLEMSLSGHLGPTERELNMEAALREIEFGNHAHDDCCPLCGNVRKRGHLDWCRIAKALEP